MWTIDNSTSVADKPTKDAAVETAPRYFFDGDPAEGILATVIPDWWLNMVQSELVAIAQLLGASPDRDDDAQCATALDGVRALRAFDADSGVAQATVALSFMLGTTNSRVRGTNTGNGLIGCLGSSDNQSSYSVGIASNALTFYSGEFYNFAAGCHTVTLAGTAGVGLASQDCALAGDYGAIIASENSCAVTAAHSAVVASDGCTADTNGGAGSNQFIAACDGVTVSDAYAGALCSSNSTIDGNKACAVACDGVNLTAGKTAAVACSGVDITTTIGAAMACDGGSANPSEINKPRSALISCRTTTIDLGAADGYSVGIASRFAYNDDDYYVFGGYDASWTDAVAGNRKWAIDSSTGTFYSDSGTYATGADYCELFPNAEGVEIEPGFAVVLQDDGSVCKTSAGDDILGVVSATPTVVGNDAPFAYAQRYVKDAFGRRVMAERYEAVQRVTEDETRLIRISPAQFEARQVAGAVGYSQTVPAAGSDKTPAYFAEIVVSVTREVIEHITVEQYNDASYPCASKRAVPCAAVNPEYDPSRPYVSRAQRPAEWVKVGMYGQIACRVVAGGTGRYLRAGDGGVMVRTNKRTNVRVIGAAVPYADGIEVVRAVVASAV